MLKISIITVCYNASQTIVETLESVVNQDYQNIEYLVIDGKSTDGTQQLIEPYLNKISTFISEPDQGIYHAINKGIRLATGDVVGLLHADDCFESHSTVSKIAQIFAVNDADCVYGDLLYVSRANSNQVVRYWKSDPFRVEKLKFGWMPPHPTFYAKRKLFDQFGFYDASFKIASDYDLMLRFLVNKSLKAAYLPEIVVRMKVGGLSNRDLRHILKKSKEDLKALKKNKVGNLFSLFLKNISKIYQFFYRQ